MIVDLDYWRKEFCSFREIMCSRKFTIDQVDDAFEGLAKVWVELCKNEEISDEEKETACELLRSTGMEKDRRAELRILAGI